MSAPAILIIAPTRRELGGLRDGCAGHRTALCGVGREAGERVAALLDAAPCSLLVSLGFAGALDPSLRPGDLVEVEGFALAPSLSHRGPLRTVAGPVGSRFRGNDVAACIGEERRSAPRLDSRLRGNDGRLCKGLHRERDGARAPIAGAILTADAPLLTPAAKRRARAASGAMAVDMEGRWIADAAAARGVPLISVRAVVDEADFEIPPFAAAIAADGGRREWARAIRAAVNPLEARRILTLAWRARKAARSLRRAADAILSSPPERL